MKRLLPILIMLLLISCPAGAEFSESSGVFDPGLAQWALSIAELCGEPAMQQGILQAEGYSQVGAYNYDRPAGDRTHVAAYTVYDKPLEGGGTAVIISVRGTSGEEWYLNLDLMPSGNYELDYAENFALAAEDVLNTHAAYLDSLADPVFLITGHSRGAAVANILGARLSDRFGAENVFAYTFASPRTVRGDYPAYDNIFNVINPTDVITYLPIPQWGFERYGVDLILPVDSAGPELIEAAKAAYRLRSDKRGPFSAPEDGGAATLALIEAMAELAPDLSRDYAARHALDHPGAAEEGEDGLTAAELAVMMFTGDLGRSQETMARLTQAENDFTPLLLCFQALNSARSSWYSAHTPAIYGAWITAALT